MKEKAEILKAFWEVEDYRDFLSYLCDKKLSPKINNRAKLAQKLGLTSGFITKLLSKKAHLSAEHAEKLASVLSFNEHETLALLDKLVLVKTKSEELRDVVNRRLRTSFSNSFAEVKTTKSEKQPHPSNPLFWKVAQYLASRKGKTLAELSAELSMSETRVKFLIEKMDNYFAIEKVGEQSFRLNLQGSFAAREPGSQSLYELGMGIRRMAVASLEQRHPIHLVDQFEHYVAGSYILPLSKEQIRTLSVKLAQLTKEVVELGKSTKITEDTKFVGVCFDMFDYEI